jgi:hypothetical protein
MTSLKSFAGKEEKEEDPWIQPFIQERTQK